MNMLVSGPDNKTTWRLTIVKRSATKVLFGSKADVQTGKSKTNGYCERFV